jgi:hypothetical protein
MPELAVPTPPPGADAAPESFWGAPAADASHLERAVRMLPPEPPPAAAPAPAAATPAPAPADAATIQRLEAAIANLEASRAVSPAVTADPTQLARALVEAMSTAADHRNAAAATAAALQRPSLAIDDPEALISDPSALVGVLRKLESDYAAYAENLVGFTEKRVLDNLSPALQRAEVVGRVAGPVLQRQIAQAEGEAAALAARHNIPEQRFRELLPAARQAIDAATNIPPEQKILMRLNPEAIVLAVQNAAFLTGGGMPITAPSAAPPAAPLPTSAVTAIPPGKTDMQRLAEHYLGRSFDFDALEKEHGHSIDIQNRTEIR